MFYDFLISELNWLPTPYRNPGNIQQELLNRYVHDYSPNQYTKYECGAGNTHSNVSVLKGKVFLLGQKSQITKIIQLQSLIQVNTNIN